ncbi:hypothetical protein EVAR_9899_1 [Eumeta japonica]|uniref:Uncharacterized protein n=1 Tax=Eumeta variegata TaxID=151549 RepID=A0A4C1TQC6_EUMVA|nr:hypothetical protein EVAR_9899_1 [Eumeta japonica]
MIVNSCMCADADPILVHALSLRVSHDDIQAQGFASKTWTSKLRVIFKTVHVLNSVNQSKTAARKQARLPNVLTTNLTLLLFSSPGLAFDLDFGLDSDFGSVQNVHKEK